MITYTLLTHTPHTHKPYTLTPIHTSHTPYAQLHTHPPHTHTHLPRLKMGEVVDQATKDPRVYRGLPVQAVKMENEGGKVLLEFQGLLESQGGWGFQEKRANLE